MDNPKDIRRERFNSTLARVAAEFLKEEANTSPLITVIDCVLSSDERHATIIVSVIPEDKADAALVFLKRKRSELQEYARDHIRSRALPAFDFKLVGKAI
jgi:ribosome-binding factor A